MTIADALTDLGARTNMSLVIFTVALLLCRILPVVILSPVLGGSAVPNEAKIGLGVLLSAVLFPAVADRIGNIPTQALPFIALLLKELFIGLTLAFVSAVVFEAAHVAGNIIDTMSGASMAQVMVPQIQQQVTLYSSLKVQLAIVLFLTLDGHHVIIQALADSFLTVPPDQYPAFSGGVWTFFELILRTFGDMMVIGIALAAPAFLATFLTDLSLGLMNRVAPQVQVFFISMSIKPMVVALVTFLAISLVMERFQLEFANMLRLFQKAIGLLA